MFREKATCARLQGPLSRVVTSSILGPLRQDNLLLAGPALQRLSLLWIKSHSKLCGVNGTVASQDRDFSFAVVEGGSSRVR